MEQVSSLQHWARNVLEMYVMQHSIWLNFILIVIRIQKKSALV